MTLLSVNLNKVALVRNGRGGKEPSVIEAAEIAMRAGAQGITVHPRPDGRHILKADVYALRDAVDVEFNVEGYPSPEFIKLITDVKPDQCTLVPDADDQLTSDHGWDLIENHDMLRDAVDKIKAADIRVSLFMDPDVHQIQRAGSIGADRIELYTESYAKAYLTREIDHTLAHFIASASSAEQQGLGVNAGHDLNKENLKTFLREVHNVLEVSIGHALISEAILEDGLANVIRKYLRVIDSARR